MAGEETSFPTLDERMKTKEISVRVGIGSLSKREAHDALVLAVIKKYRLGDISSEKIRVDLPPGVQWPSSFPVEVEDYGD